jgi:hypothetical protein
LDYATNDSFSGHLPIFVEQDEHCKRKLKSKYKKVITDETNIFTSSHPLYLIANGSRIQSSLYQLPTPMYLVFLLSFVLIIFCIYALKVGCVWKLEFGFGF